MDQKSPSLLLIAAAITALALTVIVVLADALSFANLARLHP